MLLKRLSWSVRKKGLGAVSYRLFGPHVDPMTVLSANRQQGCYPINYLLTCNYEQQGA